MFSQDAKLALVAPKGGIIAREIVPRSGRANVPDNVRPPAKPVPAPARKAAPSVTREVYDAQRQAKLINAGQEHARLDTRADGAQLPRVRVAPRVPARHLPTVYGPCPVPKERVTRRNIGRADPKGTPWFKVDGWPDDVRVIKGSYMRPEPAPKLAPLPADTVSAFVHAEPRTLRPALLPPREDRDKILTAHIPATDKARRAVALAKLQALRAAE